VSPLNRRDELDIRIRASFAGFVAGFVACALLIMMSGAL
jgi:hypothetical protein